VNNRVPVNLRTRIKHISNNVVFYGRMINCSENGMYISTQGFRLIDPEFEIIIPMEKASVKVPVKVVRIELKGNVLEGIGVKIMNLSKKYLELLITLSFNSEDQSSFDQMIT